MPARSLHRTRVAIALAVAVVASLVALVSPARAAVPPPPTGLSPANGAASADTPVLRWERDPSATRYDVQVSLSQTFTSLLWSDDTLNHQAVPTVQLPEGLLWWRVRARAGNELGEWGVSSFTRETRSAPAVIGPLNGEEFQQPEGLPVLAWQPVAGARSYAVEISPDPLFTDPRLVTTRSTSSTSVVLTELGPPNTYHWRVRALLDGNVSTAWGLGSYRILGLSLPVDWSPVSPYDPPGENDFDFVQDAVLDWTPVEGAATYDLQVSTDEEFNTVVDSRTGITGTSYARPRTLNNDQYWWRVRPVDPSGNTLDWRDVPTWKFGRSWPDQVALRYPEHQSTVGSPLFYQWDAVEHASRYRLEVSAYPDFQVPNGGIPNMNCSTVHTTWTPPTAEAKSCWPAPGRSWYWRVQAIDGDGAPEPVTEMTAGQPEVRSFVHAPEVVTMLRVRGGNSSSLPVLSWQPLAGVERYRVQATNAATGATAFDVTTHAWSYTPRTRLTPGTYRWHVIPVYPSGAQGLGLLSGSQPTFEVVAAEPGAAPAPEPDLTEPSSTDGTFKRFPTLYWRATSGADRYRVWIRRDDNVTFQQLSGTFGYPAGEDTGGTLLTPGRYEWFVEAYQGNGLLATGSVASFRIAPPERIVQHRVALHGTDFPTGAGDDENTCKTLLAEGCHELRQTPVLDWEPSADAVRYRVYLSRDAELTNVIQTIDVHSTRYAFPMALADSQAGAAYFWEVVPCTTVCVAPQRAVARFDKLGHAPSPLSPGVAFDPAQSPEADLPVVADDVTLRWEDYLQTLQTAQQGDSSLPGRATTEARTYRVETATDPGFTQRIERVEVDQTSFTSFGTTYPEGRIYWRVQVLDGTGNALPWSRTWVFVKRSPVPELTFPVDESLRGQQRFTWTPLPFAATYDVEIYRKDGEALTSVFAGSTRQVGLNPTAPLTAGHSYTWRVRRGDAKGRKGAWSDFTDFSVAPAPPTLVSPLAGTSVPPVDSLFTWQARDQARSYRFERRRVGSDAVTETVNTIATAYAPTAAIAGGDWLWRVTSLDAAGDVLGRSDWQPFTVRDVPTATTPVGISGSGEVGSDLVLTPPDWDLTDVQTSYQWLRDGAAIRNQTGTTYTVTTGDLDRVITVRATGTKLGHQAGTSESNPVRAVAGRALIATEAPSISGVPAVGQRLEASPGSWPQAPRFAYQWYRESVPVPGATSSRYTVSPDDAGRRLRVVVTATATGYEPGQAISQALAVRRIGSSTSVASAGTVKPGRKAKITVEVAAAGVDAPLGSLRVSVGSKRVATVRLIERMQGRVLLKLAKLKRGRNAVTVSYSGTAAITPSVGRTKVVVRR